MPKSKKPPVHNRREQERAARELATMIDREVERRLGPRSTFLQRNLMAAEIMREGLHRREGEDLQRMTTDEEEVDEEDVASDRLPRRPPPPPPRTRRRSTRKTVAGDVCRSARRPRTSGAGDRTRSPNPSTGEPASTTGRR